MNAALPVRRAHLGFTLIELLVALAIFAVLAVMSYGGLNQITNQAARTEAHAERLGEVQLAVTRMVDDLRQTTARPARGQYGDALAPLRGNTGVGAQLELTRAGWRNPAQQQRTTLLRVGYALREDRLVRLAWRVLDRAQDTEPQVNEVLDAVTAFEMRFLDAEREWRDAWPPPTLSGQAPGLPLAVEIRVELDDWGAIRRVVRVAG